MLYHDDDGSMKSTRTNFHITGPVTEEIATQRAIEFAKSKTDNVVNLIGVDSETLQHRHTHFRRRNDAVLRGANILDVVVTEQVKNVFCVEVTYTTKSSEKAMLYRTSFKADKVPRGDVEQKVKEYVAWVKSIGASQ